MYVHMCACLSCYLFLATASVCLLCCLASADSVFLLATFASAFLCLFRFFASCSSLSASVVSLSASVVSLTFNEGFLVSILVSTRKDCHRHMFPKCTVNIDTTTKMATHKLCSDFFAHGAAKRKATNFLSFHEPQCLKYV